MALPLGELSPKVTERAHAVSPVAKVSDAMRNLPGALKPSPLGEGFSGGGKLCGIAKSSPLWGSWQSRQALTERVGSLPEGAGAAQAASEGVYTH